MNDINHVKKLRKMADWKIKHNAQNIKQKAEVFLKTLNPNKRVMISQLPYPWNLVLTEQMDITLYLKNH